MLYTTFNLTLFLLPWGILIGAGIVLYFERRLIAIAQKRLGISFHGRHGWSHLGSDVFKFWLKSAARNSSFLDFGVLGLMGALLMWAFVCAVLFLNNGAPSMLLWDFHLLAFIVYANISSLLTMGVVSLTKSKYSSTAVSRLALLTIFCELFVSFLFLILYTKAGGFSADAVTSARPCLLLAVPPLGLALLFMLLLEAKRAPFDHTEAESELVAGHLVEFGGRTLLIFFLCEYVHVYFCVYGALIFIFPSFAASVMSLVAIV